jgi:hypothetical protein
MSLPRDEQSRQAHEEPEALAACRWVAGRLAGFQDFASNARRPLENGAYADMIEEVRAELGRVLALAEDQR